MSLFIDEVIEENARLKEKIEELKEELEIAKIITKVWNGTTTTSINY